MGISELECIILAAGSSSRLGFDKAQVKIGEFPLVRWLSDRVKTRGVSVTVVTNEKNFEGISKQLPNSNIIVNYEPERGRTGSLKVGISRIDSMNDCSYRLLIVPVDRPGFSDSTLDRIMRSDKTCCPEQSGRGGHPLLLSTEDVEIVRQSSEEIPLRDIVKPLRFKVNDKHLHLNVDTPADVEDLQKSLNSINE